jgi:glycosyltransferase involved in cell wall biosynthesis
MQTYLQSLEDLQSDDMRIFASEQPAPLSVLHNMLAQNARGEYLLFLHHDTVTINEGWVDALVRLCRRPGAVAACARKLSPDGMVQGGGVILGLGGFNKPVFEGLPIDNSGYMNRAHLTQEFSALSAGCTLVETKAFFAVGGFDTSLNNEQVATADLCVRLKEVGRLIWTPHISVMTRATTTVSDWPGTNVSEEQAQQDWEDNSDRAIAKLLPKLVHDPVYSPNLSLTTLPAFTIEPRREFNWKVLEWRPLPRILTYYADSMGCGQYRILAPTRELERLGKAQVWSGGQFPTTVELAGLEVDSQVFQRPIQQFLLPHLRRCRTFGDSFIVFELDDLITNLPEKSIHFADVPKTVGEDLRNALQLCHRFVTTTEYLKEEYKDLIDDIVVVPNYVEYPMWKDLKPQRNTSAKPRVGWVGGSAHKGDLELIAEVVQELADEVDWVFMGMCPDIIAPYVKEYSAGVPFLDYPAKMASMNLDLALAPLEYHPFNLGKSHLRLLEYGVLGWPVICTDILPYQGAYPVTRLKNNKEDWVKAIREHINDRDEMARRGATLKQYVIDNWLMQDHLDEWLKAWTRP